MRMIVFLLCLFAADNCENNATAPTEPGHWMKKVLRLTRTAPQDCVKEPKCPKNTYRVHVRSTHDPSVQGCRCLTEEQYIHSEDSGHWETELD